MRKRIVALVVALSLSLGLMALAAGDSVISLSYLNKTIRPQIETQIEENTKVMFGTPEEVDVSAVSKDGAQMAVAERALERLQMKGYAMYTTDGREIITLEKDDILSGLTGTKFLIREGNAVVANDTIVNITKGVEAKAGSGVSQNTNYMIPTGSGAGIKITSDRASVMVDGVYRVVSIRYRAQYFSLADALKKMDLFRGSNIGYELSRTATRTEALVMLIRLLGEEDEALKFTGKHPFTDVDPWAEKYVAYAYSKGYTNGISATKFGSSNPTTASHYMTFLLRALGYDDTKGDFKWDKSMDFALSCGNITLGEYEMITKSTFMRDHVAYLSYYSLFAKIKGSDMTLLDKLISEKVVSKSVAEAAIASVSIPRL